MPIKNSILKVVLIAILFYVINNLIGFYLFIPNCFENKLFGKWVESLAYLILNFSFLTYLYFKFSKTINVNKSISSISAYSFIIGVFLTLIQTLIIFLKNGYLPKKNLQFDYFNIPYIFSRVILIPIIEEIIFRSIFFKILNEKNKIVITIVITSILFSLVHFPNIYQCIVTLVLGFISGLVYYKSNNILNSILLHIGLNSSVWLMRYLF